MRNPAVANRRPPEPSLNLQLLQSPQGEYLNMFPSQYDVNATWL